MIERFVFFKLKYEYCNDAARAEFAERTRADLSALQNVRALSVGVPADEASEASWDISIVLQFDSTVVIPPDWQARVDEYSNLWLTK